MGVTGAGGAAPGAADQRGGGQEVVTAHTRSYTDGLNGETVWTYHAVDHGPAAGHGYSYMVTADNLRNGATPVQG